MHRLRVPPWDRAAYTQPHRNCKFHRTLPGNSKACRASVLKVGVVGRLFGKFGLARTIIVLPIGLSLLPPQPGVALSSSSSSIVGDAPMRSMIWTFVGGMLLVEVVVGGGAGSRAGGSHAAAHETHSASRASKPLVTLSNRLH